MVSQNAFPNMQTAYRKGIFICNFLLIIVHPKLNDNTQVRRCAVMKLSRAILLLSVVAVVLFIPLWFSMDYEDRIRMNEALDEQKQGQESVRQNQSSLNNTVERGVSKLEVDEILADDLSLTTSMFVTQLSKQLQKWADLDLTKPDIEKSFEQELSEHKHFHSFAFMKNGEILIAKGKIPEERVKKLQDSKQETSFSDPYIREDKQYMLMAHRKNNSEMVIGEVDLSFVKRFVGEMGSVADANGNFFVSSGKTDVDVESDKKSEKGKITQKVPELGWQIVVQSKPEGSEQEQTHFKDGQAVVKFRSQEDREKWLRVHAMYQVIKQSGPYVVLSQKNTSTEKLIKNLSAEQDIVSVEPNYIYNKQDTGTAVSLPNDEFFEPYQWNLSQIRAEKGWEITGGTEDVIIAILDTGIDPNHQDLKGKLVEGFNTFDETNQSTDQHGHGTHVAGITGAITNNVTGIAGVSWFNPIMPVKVLDENGEGSLYEITSGIRWATDHGAKVINMSLGDSEPSQMLYDAIRYAYEKDVVLIAAAGNDNVGTPMYPAGYDEVLSVSAVDQQQQKAVFSNYGEHIDVTAPGEHIPSTFPDNNYVFMSGTSMAAPHVTGLAGLIRSLQPELNNEEVMQVIRQTSEDLGEEGHDPFFGFGEISVAGSLDNIRINQEAALDHGAPNSVEQAEGNWLQLWLERFKVNFE
jgi:subtilisin family serine protease